jgi:hypothetical protein
MNYSHEGIGTEEHNRLPRTGRRTDAKMGRDAKQFLELLN